MAEHGLCVCCREKNQQLSSKGETYYFSHFKLHSSVSFLHRLLFENLGPQEMLSGEVVEPWEVQLTEGSW